MTVTLPRKIVLLTDCFADLSGGAERQIFELGKALSSRKIQVIIASLECGGPASLAAAESCGCRLVRFPVRRIYGLSGLIQGWKFRRFLKDEQPDILMTYHFSADIWGAAIGHRVGIKAIISNRRDMGFWREGQHIRAYQFVSSWVDRVVVNATATRDQVMREEGIPEDKIAVIFNGLPVLPAGSSGSGANLRGELWADPQSPVIVCVANMRPVKGHSVLLRAMVGVISKFRKTKLVLIGEDRMDGEVADLAEALGIISNVVFLGKRDDVQDLLQDADICVMPSLSEGMSNAIMEYMAVGKPVVATNVGGTPDLITDGYSGFLVEKEDSECLQNALLFLIENPEKSRELGRRARQRIITDFSVEKMTERYIDLFRGCLKGKVSPAADARTPVAHEPVLIKADKLDKETVPLKVAPRQREVVPVVQGVVENKVLHLISSGGLFGAEQVLLTLAKNTDSDGFVPIVGVIKDTRYGRSDLLDKAVALGCRTAVFPCRGRFDPFVIFKVQKYLSKEQIAVLHTHNYKSDAIGVLAAKMAKVPILSTAHGFTDMDQKVGYYEAFDRWLLKNFFDRVVVVTKQMLPKMSAPSKVIIPNGLDLEGPLVDKGSRAAARIRFRILENDFVIGTVGRLSREKNQGLLLKAVYPLLRENPRVKILIVGDGPKRTDLERFVQDRHLQSQVIFTGICQDIATAYAAMDVFVLCSLTEGVPLTILESMLARVPVVATPVGGVPEIVRDGETGLLVASEDAKALGEAVMRLYLNRDLIKTLTVAADTYVRKNFSLERMTMAYRDVYSRIIAEKK